MHTYYRISDNSFPKIKLPGATKKFCLNNFLTVFNKCKTTIIADNCSEETLDWIKDHPQSNQFQLEITKLGNSGALLHSLKLALEQNIHECVYFVEDDYLHLPDSVSILEDGLTRYNCVTLYDHPDKYTSQYEFGEIAQFQRTKLSHWRNTISTCMTFGTIVGRLKQNYLIWEKYLSENEIPPDHFIFSATRRSNYELGVCIPGRACHTDMTYSGTQQQILIEPWAINMMIEEHENMIDKIYDEQQSSVNRPDISIYTLRNSILGTQPLEPFENLVKLAAIVS